MVEIKDIEEKRLQLAYFISRMKGEECKREIQH